MTSIARPTCQVPLYVDFDVSCKDATGGQPKIQRKDYRPSGMLPVIDQGQSEIAGYTNDEDATYKGPLPAILFGDHTRIVKYVDKPFALGADGVKVLLARNGFEPRFLYYFLAHTEIPERGYSRHFKFLREIKITLFSLSEQRRIVEILDQADALRRLRAEAGAKAQRILPALFLKMFGDPATNPKNLRRERLGNLIKVHSGQFLPASAMDPNGTCPVYGGNGIAGYHSLHMFEDRKIVLGRVGVYCGVVHYTLPRSWVTDNALFVSQMSDDLRDRYLVEALRHLNLNQYAGRAGQPLISAGRIYPIEILVPTPREQDYFSSLATEAENLLLQQQVSLSELRALHGSVTHRAFSGELTAKWREAHREQLCAEVAEQAKLLNLPVPEAARAHA